MTLSDADYPQQEGNESVRDCHERGAEVEGEEKGPQGASAGSQQPHEQIDANQVVEDQATFGGNLKELNEKVDNVSVDNIVRSGNDIANFKAEFDCQSDELHKISIASISETVGEIRRVEAKIPPWFDPGRFNALEKALTETSDRVSQVENNLQNETHAADTLRQSKIALENTIDGYAKPKRCTSATCH